MSLKTDGKFYELKELVRANCQDCIGCHECCVGMGDTIVLDPYDMWLLRRGTGQSMQQLLETGKIALGVDEGLILPHIQMNSETDACPFLNVDGRCSIHAYRPGMCRLFPLGRNYVDGKMNYILLMEECQKKNRSKIKVCDWIGVKPAQEYHSYVLRWHDFRKKLIGVLSDAQKDEIKAINMYVLQAFYFLYEAPEDAFFADVLQKINVVEHELGIN